MNRFDRPSDPVSSGGPRRADPAAVASVRAFIRQSWPLTFRHHPETTDDLIGLPYRYSVPTISGTFQEMYYWDTYFTNEGLILDGYLQQAIDNVENIASLVDRYGKVPNGNRTWFENRSQPPYLAMMVARVHRGTADLQWLSRLVPVLEREHDFWMTRRLTPCGLNRHSHDGTRPDAEEMIATMRERLGPRFDDQLAGLSPAELVEIGSHHLAEAESGWDFTPRFAGRCEDFCPVDLNANLHLYETLMASFAAELGRPASAEAWRVRAEQRRMALHRHCRDPRTGMYHDYDFVHDRRSDVCSAAVFSLLYAGVLAPADASRLAREALRQLELAHGISACAPGRYDHSYQWSYPNAWAPLTFIACVGLASCGLHQDARRLATKYVATIADTFARTGNLWEKYNAVDGSLDVADEYEMPTMMGWTAGVFVWAAEWLGSA